MMVHSLFGQFPWIISLYIVFTLGRARLAAKMVSVIGILSVAVAAGLQEIFSGPLAAVGMCRLRRRLKMSLLRDAEVVLAYCCFSAGWSFWSREKCETFSRRCTKTVLENGKRKGAAKPV